MINTEGMVAETATKIYTDLCARDVPHEAEAGQYPQALWDALTENGLPLAWVSEANGGFGADHDEVFGAIWASAQAASPVPFAETLIATCSTRRITKSRCSTIAWPSARRKNRCPPMA